MERLSYVPPKGSANRGVYFIVNLVNKKLYVGSSNNLRVRCRAHRWELNRNNHANQHLQAAWNKYGEDSFRFGLIEEVAVKDLLKREQHYLDTMQPWKIGYNICKSAVAPMRGCKPSDQSKNKRRVRCEGKNNPLYGSGEKIEFKGKKLSVREWEEETGIIRSAIFSRLKDGWSVERALTERVADNTGRAPKYEFEGKSHTVKEWSTITGIGIVVINDRLRKGWPIEKVLTKKFETYTFQGKTHTLTEWGNITGIDRDVLDWRLKKGWTLERTLTEPNMPVVERAPRYEFEGESLTIKEWAEKSGICIATLQGRISKLGWTIEKALTTPVKGINKIKYKGQSKTIKEWSEITGIPATSIRQRLYVLGWSVEHALTEPVMNKTERATQYEFQGKLHTLSEWAEITGFELQVLKTRVNSNGWTIERALTTPVRPRVKLVTYKGKTKSLDEWCNILNLNKRTIRGRLNNYGWSVTRAFTTPVQRRA